MPIELQHWNEAVRLYRKDLAGTMMPDHHKEMLFAIALCRDVGLLASPNQTAHGK